MSTIRNLQNITRDPRIRKLFVANAPGEVLVEADLSQAEGMIVAWFAQERRLMELYRTGQDVHSIVGSIVMQKQISKKETPMERQVSKTVVHASNYGTSPQKISEVLLDQAGIVMEVGEAKKRQAIYYQNFPGIVSGFQKGIERELLEKNRTITTPDGWTRKFYSPLGHELYRQAYAHYPQHCVAFITNTAVNRIRYNSPFGKSLYTQTHDSVCLSVPEEKLPEAIDALKRALWVPLYIKGEELVIPSELKWGLSLGELKEIK